MRSDGIMYLETLISPQNLSKKHPYKKWDWNAISINDTFTWKDVKQNQEFPWEPSSLVRNKSFSETDLEEVIKKYPWQSNIWNNRNLILGNSLRNI